MKRSTTGGVRGLVRGLGGRILGLWVGAVIAQAAGSLEVGLAVRDVTPREPIWLAGYAARTHASERVDTPLLVQSLALRSGADPVVLVALDNCEVSGRFTAPVLEALRQRHGLRPGAVMIVSSHTHYSPVVEGPLEGMYPMTEADQERVRQYGEALRSALEGVVTAALADLQPSLLEYGSAQARFAMNRRVFREDGVVIGENPDGPADREVPVLKVVGTNDAVRAIVFGYACHATSIAGDDFYTVSGDYLAYARQHLEACYPGAVALFLTGMGGDANPAPRGSLLASKRHGLELAGAVAGRLSRPMRPVRGSVRLAYAEVELPLEGPPNREQLEVDARSTDAHVRRRAASHLALLERGEKLPESVRLPMAAVRIGDELTWLAMAGEVVVDYARRFKREFGADQPWTIGYAYEVPCYIPSMRVLREGGYEPHGSLVYYGVYGPFRPALETRIVEAMTRLVEQVRAE